MQETKGRNISTGSSSIRGRNFPLQRIYEVKEFLAIEFSDYVIDSILNDWDLYQFLNWYS